jgi:hypothetical protein
MGRLRVHQAIHGYRDGHRLVSSSTPLPIDASRAMLVLSDMSGPSMYPGFEEYMTGYPLAGTNFYVLAKTWYASEMQRPGCVWTHSLLIDRRDISGVSIHDMLRIFQRPTAETADDLGARVAEIAAAARRDAQSAVLQDPRLAKAVLAAVFTQTRPVLVVTDGSDRAECAFLTVWDALWSSAKIRFSFCTGALAPRLIGGSLMDLQSVPRATQTSILRRSAQAALILETPAAINEQHWTDSIFEDINNENHDFADWISAIAGEDASRAVTSMLGPVFSAWRSPGATAYAWLKAVAASGISDARTIERLLWRVFDRAECDLGIPGMSNIVTTMCTEADEEFPFPLDLALDRVRHLFSTSRDEGTRFVAALLNIRLSEYGDRVLRSAIALLEPTDIQRFEPALDRFLPAIIGENPALATSPHAWRRAGFKGGDILLQLANSNVEPVLRDEILWTAITSSGDVPVDPLVRFGGRAAIHLGLAAISSGSVDLSWDWRSVFRASPDTVLEWLESLAAPTARELDLGSQFLTPALTQQRLVAIWSRGSLDDLSDWPRTAAFGLALAFYQNDVHSSLFARCFQPTYEAAKASRLDFHVWEWLDANAPPRHRWRDWDKCERLATALATLAERQGASLDTVFAIAKSPEALGQICEALDDKRGTRKYLHDLQAQAVAGQRGSHWQRAALLPRP